MTPIARRTLAAGLAGIAVPLRARAAETWPARPVTLIVPNPPGGGTDFAARLFQEPLGRLLGQPVVIDNRSGGNGNVGILAVARARPDGYTVLLQYSAYHGANAALAPDIGWDPDRDLRAVGMGTLAPHVVFCANALPARDMAGLVAHIRANPGRVTYASAGTGSMQHIAGLLLAKLAGTEMIHVPYRGAAPALQDVAGGRVDLFVTTPSSGMSLLQGGQVRALAVAADARLTALPALPTAAEAGLPGYAVEAWFGFFAPAGTPDPVVERLNAALREAARNPALRERAEASGAVLRAVTVAEMEALGREAVASLGRVVRDNNLRAE